MYIQQKISKNHIAYQSSPKIIAICEHLFANSNIAFFCYGRNYKDGGTLRLHTSNDYFESWLDNQYAWCPTFLKPGWYMWSDIQSKDQIELRESQFNLGNGISIIKACKNYTEIFSFAPLKGTSISELFLNQWDILERFNHFFLQKAQYIISQAESDLIYIPGKCKIPVDYSSQQNHNREKLIEKYPIAKLKIPNNKATENCTTLSEKELSVLKSILKGKTAKDIANELKVSAKTVETYTSRVKSKFNCSSRSELIHYAWEIGIIDTYSLLE